MFFSTTIPLRPLSCLLILSLMSLSATPKTPWTFGWMTQSLPFLSNMPSEPSSSLQRLPLPRFPLIPLLRRAASPPIMPHNQAQTLLSILTIWVLLLRPLRLQVATPLPPPPCATYSGTKSFQRERAQPLSTASSPLSSNSIFCQSYYHFL